jgi:NADPH:quinone reductase-like Zn-dependent oxidoreductase
LGLTKPKITILGFDFAGEIVETGKDITSFKVGDKVFGGTTTLGSYAEYTCVNMNDVITIMPENISYQEAAPVSGSGITVMNFLKGLAKIKAGDKLLVNGASGSLGTYAVQISKQFGAEVTGICSTANMKMVKELGADFVIDYTNTDFTKAGKQYDVIFDTIGKTSFSECKNSLTENGIYLSSVISLPLLWQIIKTSLFGTKKARSSSTGMLPVKERLIYFLELKELLKTEKIKTVIDNTYSLSQMADAHKYVEKGHKKGNIIISM